jgi:hypothetical protein
MLVAQKSKAKVQLGRTEQHQVSQSSGANHQANHKAGLPAGSWRLQWFVAPASAGKKRVLRARWRRVNHVDQSNG